MAGKTLAVITPAREDGGAEQYVRILVRAALDAGISAHVGVSATAPLAYLRRDLTAMGAHVHPLEIGQVGPRGTREAVAQFVWETHRTWKMLNRARADATMVVLPHPDQVPGAVLAAALRRGVSAASVHLFSPGLEFTPARRAVYTLARRAGMRWIAVSEHNRAALEEALGWPTATVARIYNGVETRELPGEDERRRLRAEVRSELGLGAEARLLLSLGRLNRQKAQDVIIDAAPQIVATFPEACFLFAGEGPERGALHDRARARAVEDHVRFLGWRSDVWRLMSASDVFLFPSRYEGIGFAVLEANIAALPVIVSDAGPLPEVVTHRVDGLVVQVDSSEDLARGTIWALAHPDEMAQMANCGRAKATAEFSRAEMVRATLVALRLP
jgi:glycosyltransferase involved in cell wall biosynthesis